MWSWKQIAALVPHSARHAVDWAACLEAFPQLELAKTTPQDPIYHAEGDVWTHTQMVVTELLQDGDYAGLTNEERETVFLAALLHDVAKCSTTQIADDGRIAQPGHSRRGALDARLMLWEAGTPVARREAVCRLIAVHQVPFFAFADSRRGVSSEFMVRELSWQVDLHLLVLLARADIRGRICPDVDNVLVNIELFRELALEEGCLHKPRSFASAETAVRYFRGAELHPDYALHEEPGSRVIVMCGLPASGKNHWVAQHHPGLPVVSFDDACTELGLRHGENEGAAAHHAVDKAKSLLRSKAAFVWNATHLSRQMRGKTLDLCLAYGAQVELVHLEASRSTLLARNSKRDTTLGNAALLGMLHRWEVPLPTEAHGLQLLVNE
ncbi:AAA family ATPase [Comamonas testosteroni]|uniref:Metal-dependent phosphohydrolase n=1 Tax=Comamonas testosteroni TaxID=285 RepID=A0A096GZB7_COMTE|nr:AAA family ATPase [Comamonas testosteroni]KGH30505.1 metal-dependent phosphohydrolase [Comamonas testosteroni]